MSENTQPLTVMTKTPGHRFESGHPRWGGKRKNSTQLVRDLCAEMDVDPMRFMLALIKDGFTTQVVIENGKKKRVEVVASLDMRADLSKYVSKFLYPVLSASQISGPDEGPIAVAELDMNKLLQDPASVELMQSLALRMAGYGEPALLKQLPAGDTPDVPGIQVKTDEN
jgi:hypothetical protein